MFWTLLLCVSRKMSACYINSSKSYAQARECPVSDVGHREHVLFEVRHDMLRFSQAKHKLPDPIGAVAVPLQGLLERLENDALGIVLVQAQDTHYLGALLTSETF